MRTVAVLAMILFSVGCSRKAIIYKRGGGVEIGEIVRGDATSIYLADDTEVLRAEIDDIDHPGDGHAIFGGVLALVEMGVGS